MKCLKFSECLEKRKMGTKKSIQKTNYSSSGNFPIIDQGAEFIAGYTQEKEFVINEALPVIVFGDHTRISKYIDFPFAQGADGTKLIFPNKNHLDPLFFFYRLLSLKIPSKGYNRHYKILKEMEIIFPSCKQTQRSISKVLRTIQDSIEIRKKELNLQRELKEALMAHLFKNGTKNEPLKETEIGLIPQSWSLSLLGEIVKLKSGETRPKILSEKATEKYKVPVYGGNGITGYTSEVFTQKKLIVVGRVGEYCGCVHIADAPNWITDNALYSHEWFQEIDIEYFANLLLLI